MTPAALFRDFSARKLRQQAQRIAVCLGQLDEHQIWQRPNENSNAIGNLVLHLCGNVRQWIVAGIGAAPDTRQRDAEFTARHGLSPSALANQLHATIEAACTVIENLPEARLEEPLSVQGYHVTVLEAVYHVVEHFSGHTGQIIQATKALTGQPLDFYAHLSGQHTERTP